jgi:hypothetical protein
MAVDAEHPTSGEPGTYPAAIEADEAGDDASLLEARRLRRLGEKNYVTGRIGETCRYIGFGVLAIFYTIITSDKSFAIAIASHHRFLLYLAGVTGAVTIFVDYLQYLAGAWSVDRALTRADGTYLYNQTWISYRLRSIFYYIKQITALVASGIVVYIIMIQFALAN